MDKRKRTFKTKRNWQNKAHDNVKVVGQNALKFLMGKQAYECVFSAITLSGKTQSENQAVASEDDLCFRTYLKGGDNEVLQYNF